MSEAPELVRQLADAITPPPGPLEVDKNIAYRAELVRMGNESPDFAAAVNHKCKNDPVFWMNTFAWTQNPKDFDDPHRPVVLFPKQELYVRTLHSHIEGKKPLLLEKSREQLASVATANYAVWRLFYCKNADLLVGSYREEAVDSDSYAEAIMPKMDYTIEHLPRWMLPIGFDMKKHRKFKKLINPETGKVIKGDTCNEKFSRGSRYAWVWLDEFAFIKGALQDEIHSAVANASKCFVYTTTPKGIEKFATLAQDPKIAKFKLHWTDNYFWHPKGHAPDECHWENETWPKDWICSEGCRWHPAGGKPHSERYDDECTRQNDPVKVAQELDINYQKSGSAVFDPDKVQAAIGHIIKKRPEFRRYKLRFKETERIVIPAGADEDVDKIYYRQAKKWSVVAEQSETGPFKVWKEPFSCRDRECACRGTGLHTYVLGGDTARNIDGDADCAYILDITAGEIVAEWHGHSDSKRLAIEWVKICKWYGSSSIPAAPNAWAVIEHNGDGKLVCEVMVEMGLHVHISRNEAQIKRGFMPRLGVVVSGHNKNKILNQYMKPEINNGDAANPLLPRLVCPFMEFWVECSTFIYKYSDKTENRPEEARMEAQTRKQHDDRVMAMAMAIYGAYDRFGKIRGYIRKSESGKRLMHRMERIGAH